MASLQQKVALVIVTYNRADYLKNLLESIVQSHLLPWKVLVVDNASTDNTQTLLESFVDKLPNCLINLRLQENTGGSGGFHHGVKEAYRLGADWFWLMDDDVLVLPDGLSALLKWGEKFKCLHGRRYDFDGSPFFWQPVFNTQLATPLPYFFDPFKEKNYFLTNSGCFEGMFIHREIVAKIGFPDPRFFITWDDAIYGWLASQVTDVAYVNEFVLKRARFQQQISLGLRHLNDASDLFRFNVMKNRAYIAKYFQIYGVYQPITFAFGTFLNFAKEVFRLWFVNRQLKGFSSIWQGWRASRKLLQDKAWQPMPPLD